MLITIPSMIASTMVAVDITIANVALPHMQSSLSASQEQVLWVLTSYLVAGAIATPLSGWLAGRVGRKNVMLFSVGGFTLASAFCGLSTSLTMIVLARFLQGACGAALIPLSQAILLDINPPEEHAKAMAIFALGSMAGPIIGPTLGGYLTDTLSWRWVFFINVPFGILSFLGMLAFLVRRHNREVPRFDLFGFLTVSVSLTALQLILDRGEHLDWWESGEIWIYTLVLAIAGYLAIVHMFTAKGTFIRPELFRDRNFAIGSIFSMMIGIVAFATIPMIVVMTQSLLGYSALHTGLVGLPRAFGTLVSMVIVTRLVALLDVRVIIISGLTIMGTSMLMYSHMDLYVDERALLVTGFVQGFGSGLIFVPLSVVVFSTLAPNLRNEGASMYALTRNIGNAIGISLLNVQLVRDIAASRNDLVQNLRPDNPAVLYARPNLDFGSTEALARVNAEIMRQAAMVGNVSIYHLVFALTFGLIPLVLLLRVIKIKAETATLPIGE
ncbi:MDR family MFS transporter [Novosphingobium mangrovi (ex Huang et al. 2023)]|uniref:DHA2 family efflux MFS transporter permease subunit n=1 Tax=Novosphingobium mangrovi (ex Huang et al. 2023) TaxID=2976432 RepID=A0ABT2I577_9SPHN|nr:DHA2 family efflux MFS transporter permease subunit [Novosphingobium mangrovi (ex Huang et al. 2023)]MCT2399965.1 DHA2 family efflux MFS transporter permease subunit [Novosphingobium mangrovi (ex Huang et al. 2023)]